MSGETMREAVARAIAKELTGGFPSSPKSIDHKAADAAIRTVLERLREPSVVAIRYGTYEAETCVKDDPCGKAGLHVWKTMVEQLERELQLDAAVREVGLTDNYADN